MDPVAFATARLDEDEAAAKDLIGATRFIGRKPDFYGCGGPAAEAFWERSDPARTLREIEGTRRILARYQDCLIRMEDPDYPQGAARDQAREYEDFVLPNLLAKWADHPDYDPEWEPA